MGYTATRQAIRLSELYSFTDKQAAARDACFRRRFILYGGARGGGKSYWLRWMLLHLLLYWYFHEGIKGVIVGLFCDTYPELRDRQINKINSEFPAWMGEVKETKEDGLCFFLRPDLGGGKIALRNLDDARKYRSAEFAAVAVDELTLIPLDTFNILRGSLRWPGIAHTLFLAATNPGGLGHLWVKRYWIDQDYPPEMRELGSQFEFIKSLPADNPHLDKTYWDDLNSLPPDLARAWVQGDWNVFAGQAFGTWRDDTHVIDPFQLPDHWPRWRGIDWGYDAPFCCLWIAKDPATGRYYAYREAYVRELIDRDQAKLIRDMTMPAEQIIASYADPSMWARKTQVTITSTADEYAAAGVPLTPGDNDRLSGKRKVDRMLQNLPDGKPGLMVFATCRNLIRTLPALPYDDTRIEDINTKAEDHGYDALRYALSAARDKVENGKPYTAGPLAQGRK